MARWGSAPPGLGGPTNRIFTEFHDEDLGRSIIAHIERVTRRFPNRVAVIDSDTSLSFAEVWDGLSGLAEQIEDETKSSDLIGIMLPTSSMFCVAILACLAAGWPLVAIDPHYPGE